MREWAIVAVLVAIGFAGCITDESLEPDSEADVQAQYKQKEPGTQMPERQFEPKLIFDTKFFEVEQGDEVILEFDITDIEDYPFPLTFIDWNVTYNREPNPVKEGDATQLPGTWNRTLHAEDYHLFRFNVDDGQGFKSNQSIIIKVGEPPVIEGDIEEVLEDVPTNDGGAVYEPMTIDENILVYPSCSQACFGAMLLTFHGHSLSARECVGLQVQRNGWGCAFIEIPHGAHGSMLTVSTDGQQVQGEFLDACAPYAHRVGGIVAGQYIDVLYPEVTVEIPVGARCFVAYPDGAKADQASPADSERHRVFITVPEFQHPVEGAIPFLEEEGPKLEWSDGPLSACYDGGDVDFLLDEFSPYDYHASNYWCAGMNAGPYMSSYADGAWIPLDERYWGAAVTTTSSLGDSSVPNGAQDPVLGINTADSNCFFLDHMLNIIGEAHNGDGPCTGQVPEGSRWMYVFLYWAPAYSVSTTFVLDDAVAANAMRTVGATLMEDYVNEGDYWRNVNTGICYAYSPGNPTLGLFAAGTVPAASVNGFIYNWDGGWWSGESNGIPGLQVDDNFFTDAVGPDGGDTWGRYSAPGCQGGDVILI